MHHDDARVREMIETQATGATAWQRAMARDGEAMHALEDSLNALLRHYQGSESSTPRDLNVLLGTLRWLGERHPDLVLEIT